MLRGLRQRLAIERERHIYRVQLPALAGLWVADRLLVGRRRQRGRKDGPSSPVLRRLRQHLAGAAERRLRRVQLPALAGLRIAVRLLVGRRLQRRREGGPNSPVLRGLRQSVAVSGSWSC